MSDSFVTPWTVALQALVHGISQARILWWVPCPPPRDLPDPGIKPKSPALAGGFFTTESSGKPLSLFCFPLKKKKSGKNQENLPRSLFLLTFRDWMRLSSATFLCPTPVWSLVFEMQKTTRRKSLLCSYAFPYWWESICRMVLFLGDVCSDVIWGHREGLYPKGASPGCWQLPENCHLGTKLLSHWEFRLQVQIAHDGQQGV